MMRMSKTFLLVPFLVIGCGSEGAELPQQEASAAVSAVPSAMTSAVALVEESTEVTLSHDCSCLDFEDDKFVDSCVSPVVECTDEEVLLCVAE